MASAAVAHPAAPGVPTIFPLAKDQQAVFELYTSETLIRKLSRDFCFIWNNPAKAAELRTRLLTWSGLGGAIGGATSYLGLQYFQSGEKSKKDTKLTIKVTCLGAGVGASVGALAGTGKTVLEVDHNSQEYISWRGEAMRTNVYPLFRQFLIQTDELREFADERFTEDLISIPVRTPNGKVYEKAKIEEWLSRRAIEYPPERLATMSEERRNEILPTFCPDRSCHLTSDMLVYDFGYHQRLSVALKRVLDREIPEQFRLGLLSYRVAMFNDRESLMREIVRDLTAKYTSGAISRREFDAACDECRAHYGLAQ
jgi:hypothetical protein